MPRLRKIEKFTERKNLNKRSWGNLTGWIKFIEKTVKARMYPVM